MRPRIWPVFVAYLVAVMTIILSSLVALGVLQAAYPDVPPADLFGSATGLIAGALASATALVLTVMLVSQPLQAKTLGLLPGREQGLDLAAAVVATLALGQALDSVTILAGREGAMRDIRRALAGAEGAELFAAVLVLGVAAAAAGELVFWGYMQTRPRAARPPGAAIVATSAAFGLLHMDWVHAAMAFVLGLYFGALTERTGSALPAIVFGASCIGLLARRPPRAPPAAPDC